ncbi:type 4b pilus protein PilO2 [Photorhabdus heterorhabditis]|uniref:type 4b pilus protein PilO2 n=1 Tax=Photorhabdus heterorhabditis TaxID=880156 RepID=UPI001562AE98|nr:type 4b pilus protein PilO2 [Photorhabdus heterorhabditis]NRN28681.1 type 4b pilus protein PilO2 [Photorhabdus heterorhabditis subsp. aluminescens]
MTQTETGVERAMQIKLYGKTLVAGIIWQPPVTALARSNIRRSGIAAGFTLVVRHRVGRCIQVGYIPKEAGALGCYSLAVILAKAVDKPNWIGAFCLPDGQYALVAVHQGAIMSGRDLIGTREEIEAKLCDTVQLVEGANGVWNAIYAPPEFESPWPEMSLVQLLPKSALRKSIGQIESLTGEMSKYQIKVFGMTVGTVFLLAGGWWMWHIYQQNTAIRVPDLSNEVVEVPPPHPWLAQPKMAWQFSAWNKALAKVPLSLAGWQVESIMLDTNTVSVSYQRHDGMPINIFQVAAINIFRAGPVISNGGEQAQVLIPFEQPQGHDQGNNDDVLQPSDQALIELMSYFQALGLPSPALTEGASVLPPPPPLLPGGETRVWSNPDWQTYDWTLTSQLSPDALFSGKPLPGLRVTSARIVLSDGFPEWKLSGVFYAKN